MDNLVGMGFKQALAARAVLKYDKDEKEVEINFPHIPWTFLGIWGKESLNK